MCVVGGVCVHVAVCVGGDVVGGVGGDVVCVGGDAVVCVGRDVVVCVGGDVVVCVLVGKLAEGRRGHSAPQHTPSVPSGGRPPQDNETSSVPLRTPSDRWKNWPPLQWTASFVPSSEIFTSLCFTLSLSLSSPTA